MRQNQKKKKRHKECLCHFGDDDIVIRNIRLNPVNVFPVSWIKNQEMSFYMDDGDDIYFLTIRNNEKWIVTILHTREIYDIVMELPIVESNKEQLYHIVDILCSIPYTQKLRFGDTKVFHIF